MEEEEDGGLYQQLHKLSSIKKSSSSSDKEEDETEGTEEDRERVVIIIQDILLSLWNTRKTGLSSPEKSRFQSLLHLPSLSLLDPVLACLRSLMRKYVHENLNGDDLLKLFPPNLPIHLQSILLFLFHKHQPHWRRTLHHHPSLTTSVPVLPLPPPPFLEPPFLWPRHNGSNNIIFGASSAPLIPDSNLSLQRGGGALLPLDHDHQEMLPRLKSMTWSMDKAKSAPANKLAVITLKLQDYTNSTSGEMEVKFRLTRETLEAMLRSMTYISEQLSSIVGSSSGPVQKKQRQSDHIV